MSIEEPIWWRYVKLKEVDGVGFVKGFVDGTPQDVIEEYKRDMEEARRRKLEEPDLLE